jgi:hypothetical protein
MTSLRSGSTQNYSANWGTAFGEKKSANTKSANTKSANTKSAKALNTKSKAVKKSTRTKKVSKK